MPRQTNKQQKQHNSRHTAKIKPNIELKPKRRKKNQKNKKQKKNKKT
jgi:hypothetical protein